MPTESKAATRGSARGRIRRPLPRSWSLVAVMATTRLQDPPCVTSRRPAAVFLTSRAALVVPLFRWSAPVATRPSETQQRSGVEIDLEGLAGGQAFAGLGNALLDVM